MSIHTGPDILMEDHGSLVLLIPMSPNAFEWFQEHLPEDCPRVGARYAIEPRDVMDILNGARNDGLAVARGTPEVYTKSCRILARSSTTTSQTCTSKTRRKSAR